MAFKDLFERLGEETTEKLEREFSNYLLPGETIQIVFKLVRDAVIFTDKRVVLFDKQGATGQKVTVESIFLPSIVGVTVETAGFGVDESVLILTYITSPYYRSHHPLLVTKKLDFQKKVDIKSLYVMLEELAYTNCQKINA